MDNLVLLRTTAVLDRALRDSIVAEVRAEGAHRYRIRFESGELRRSVCVSLRPELPWIARPAARSKKARSGRSDGFAGACRRALEGAVVASVEKPTSDRVVRLRFGDGRALVIELATHGANLVLLGSDGLVESSARRPRSAARRLEPGHPYGSRPLPRRQLDPFTGHPDEIDAFLERAVAEGEERFEAVRRRLFGVGTEGARLVIDEARSTGRSVGHVLVDRIRDLREGRIDPVVLASDDPLELVERGAFDAETVRLLPWDPAQVPAGLSAHRRGDAAATAGLYHEARERALDLAGRLDALRGILRREVGRSWDLGRRIARDLEAFEEPDRHRRLGEALLAGLAVAERHGETVRVPDPWEADRSLVVPARRGLPLTDVAASLFDRHRRAKRGLEAARRRLEQVEARRGRLERLAATSSSVETTAAAEELEGAMRDEGIPVGLARSGGRRSGGPEPVRVEGVRMFTAGDGASILVGRSGRANDRLTFKIASPEDFWLHALGRAGAHVILRNPRRAPRPSSGSLEEAAALAAWYSQARDEAHVEVQWTRRRNVRRARGAPPGTVLVKRFETVRVRPVRPVGSAETP